MSEQPNTDSKRNQLENKSRLLLAATVLAPIAIFCGVMSLWLTPEADRTLYRWMLSGAMIALFTLVIVLNLVAYRRVRKQLSTEGATSQETQQSDG